MPRLSFQVESAAPVEFAIAPQIAFALRISNADPDEHIQNVLLNCQIRLDVARRPYSAAEQRRLVDLFGAPDRWNQTLRNMLWTHASMTVPAFRGATLVDLPATCTFDFNVAATKYFYALEEGVVPLELLFSGTVFYQADDRLQVAQIPWSSELKYRLPVSVWRGMMDLYYPNTTWLQIRRDVFERLLQLKQDRGWPTWEQCFEHLLDAEECRSRLPDGTLI
jgi:hypothetical protein